MIAVVALVVATLGGLELASGLISDPTGSPGGRATPGVTEHERAARQPERAPAAAPAPTEGAINPDVPGITTFRGNLTRSYYGEGPVPERPSVLWRYPRSGGMCSPSTDETGTHTWCGVGWTGQPNVIPGEDGKLELRFGAYDAHYHFLRARTGRQLRPDLVTGDLAKGSATSDPDGYPLYYAGSRDDHFRIVALDRRRPTVLWSLDANTSAPDPTWNNDWDGAALVVGDYLIEGGENSWLYVIKLNRGWTRKGKVRVRPRVVLTVPSWDGRLASAAPDRHFSIENSVSFHDGVVYFANSAGLVQGWDISRVLRGGRRAKRVFRFWTGDDTDASVVIDGDGRLYVASELEKMNGRSAQVGQLMKLDPTRPRRPLLWSVPIREQNAGKGGSWSTPALDRELVYVATNAGGLLAVDRDSGRIRWRIRLPGPTWSSPVVVDDVLLQGDCVGDLHAYDVSDQSRRPPELWNLTLGGCIEATPAVWKGLIFVGTRAGAMYGIGERR
jgi:outer membrane protein assembly factor BamB